MVSKKILFIILLVVTATIYSQENDISIESEFEGELKKHSLALALGHTYISGGITEDNRQWISAPSFAIHYNYKINKNWTIGLHNDIIIESFIIENPSSSDDELAREYPISNILIGIYEFSENWGVALGAGIEWEKNENFALLRMGIEYGVDLKNPNYNLFFMLNYDLLIEGYDSFNFGIGINKFFK